MQSFTIVSVFEVFTAVLLLFVKQLKLICIAIYICYTTEVNFYSYLHYEILFVIRKKSICIVI